MCVLRFLHLAIIHKAIEDALEMIKRSHNHPFLNIHNHQRQVIKGPGSLITGSRVC